MIDEKFRIIFTLNIKLSGFFFSTDTHYLNMITESALWMITQPHKNKPNFPIKKKAQGFGVSVFVCLCVGWTEASISNSP